jgi:ribose 5-phosphate isomerase RpiB
VLGVDFLGIKLCTDLVIDYLQSDFDYEERNMLRIAMMMDFEKLPQSNVND